MREQHILIAMLLGALAGGAIAIPVGVLTADWARRQYVAFKISQWRRSLPVKQSKPKPIPLCAVCRCEVTELFRNPLGEDVTCWYHADCVSQLRTSSNVMAVVATVHSQRGQGIDQSSEQRVEYLGV